MTGAKALLRSVLALVAATLCAIAIGLCGDVAIAYLNPLAYRADGSTSSLVVLLLSLCVVVLSALAGGATAARLAPRWRLQHALLSGMIGLILAFIATLILWNTAPAWYHIGSVILIVPAAGAGGWLVVR